MLGWWETIILGLVQGFTEFLPISSSGHLVFARELFGYQDNLLLLDVVLHFGTLIAVIVYFWRDLLKLSWQQVQMILLGSTPLLVVLLFRNQVELLFTNILVVAAGFAVTGLINLKSDSLLEEQNDPEVVAKDIVGWKEALLVGAAQLLAIIPGISRSGSTVFAGLFARLDRYTAFKYSFFLSIPAVGGATLVQSLRLTSEVGVPYLLLSAGFIIALVSGLLSLRLLEYLIVSARLKIFGWYSLALAAGVFLYSFLA